LPPTVTISTTDGTAGESGADQALSFTISRSGDTSAPLQVPLTASGTATASDDYSGFQSSVTIPIGQTTAVLSLAVLSDNAAEGDETVTIRLGSSVAFLAGSPSSANATIADRAAQAWFVQNITDPTKRGPADDADLDGVPNLAEYFMGSSPNGGAAPATPVQIDGGGNVTFIYPRALNRTGVTAVVEWSTSLVQWFRSGQTNGTHVLNINESTNSAPTDDPQIIKATVTSPTGTLPTPLFFRLNISE
ncbi:MAG: Calx-beta domain-containing protein, partial [Roseimicrobium sp.]